MKSFHILFVFMAFLFVSLHLTLAQTHKDHLSEEENKELMEGLKEYDEVLQLSEEQKPEFEAITRKFVMQMKGLKDSDDSRFSKYQKVKSFQEAKNAAMKKLLSTEQYQPYLKKQEELQERLQARRKN